MIGPGMYYYRMRKQSTSTLLLFPASSSPGSVSVPVPRDLRVRNPAIHTLDPSSQLSQQRFLPRPPFLLLLLLLHRTRVLSVWSAGFCRKRWNSAGTGGRRMQGFRGWWFCGGRGRLGSWLGRSGGSRGWFGGGSRGWLDGGRHLRTGCFFFCNCRDGADWGVLIQSVRRDVGGSVGRVTSWLGLCTKVPRHSLLYITDERAGAFGDLFYGDYRWPF